MARLSDVSYLEAEIKEAGLDAKNKVKELTAYLKDQLVSARRIAKKATK